MILERFYEEISNAISGRVLDAMLGEIIGGISRELLKEVVDGSILG